MSALVDDHPYRKRIEEALGARDPLAVLWETPRLLGDIVRGHTAAELRARPFQGKWTVNEIVGHLSDAEWAWGWRMRLVLGQQRPALAGFDQEAWVAAQAHNQREPGELLEMFAALRCFNLALWRRIAAQDLNRVGVHAERGAETLGQMLRLHAGHDLLHLDQITRYLAAVTSGA